MSAHNTTPAFARADPPTQQRETDMLISLQQLQGDLGAEQEKSDLLETQLEQTRITVRNLGNALERQKKIDELSPAARALEQRAIDTIYLEAVKTL